MPAIDISKMRTAVGREMRAIADEVENVMEERGLNATRDTVRSIRTVAVADATGVTGMLEAGGWWRYVGSGRGPGGMPPIGRIERWVEAKGMNVSPWAVAVKIRKDGTRDWRRKMPNAFLQGVERWERGDGFGRLGDVAVDVYGNGAADVIVTNLR